MHQQILNFLSVLYSFQTTQLEPIHLRNDSKKMWDYTYLCRALCSQSPYSFFFISSVFVPNFVTFVLLADLSRLCSFSNTIFCSKVWILSMCIIDAYFDFHFFPSHPFGFLLFVIKENFWSSWHWNIYVLIFHLALKFVIQVGRPSMHKPEEVKDRKRTVPFTLSIK